MKKFLLIAAALLPLALSAKSPELQITPAELPTGVEVAPTQGFIDTSNSDSGYPLGAGAIAIVFNYQELVINQNCETPAKIYVDDFETPAAESFARGIDIDSHLIGTVLFKRGDYSNTGIYKVEVPEGFFLYADGTDDNGDLYGTIPTPALTLYYEIYVGYSITPTPGVVAEIQDIVISFPDADEVEMNAGVDAIEFFMDNGADYTVVTTIMDYDGDGKKNDVVLSLSDGGIAIEALIDAGTYSLLVPAGKFTYKTYGDNYATDPEDYVERQSEYLFFKYVIPSFPQPAILPSTEDIQTEFVEFDIILPEGFQVMLRNDKVNSGIYTVSDNGVVNDGAAIMNARINPASFYDATTGTYNWPDEIVLELYDMDTYEFIDKWVPEDGNYCLRLGKSLFSGTYTNASGTTFASSPEFDYFYTVKNTSTDTSVIDVEKAELPDETVTVYTLTGIRVALNADKAVLGELAPGLYIVNGKKMLKH